ncbi:hypothetical protein [Haloarchaeobius sp. HME9146]|uniref:DUF7410 domain-containing protein n=1 Tax=Haloarchaeobius sp. HME9146 TaxID=2978732 RepID=UPI0021BFF7C8|nr:hypothetical protein [Haloarchaeobius sp. HME9146]MCT9096051.1 hypothetical protein [Haloarchaeobius sp. HME9146]
MATHDIDHTRSTDSPPGDTEMQAETATTILEEETVAARCRVCDRPFPSEHLHALHLGERHRDDLTAEEYETYAQAKDEEDDELFLYHLKVIATLGSLYAVIVLVYMIVLSL